MLLTQHNNNLHKLDLWVVVGVQLVDFSKFLRMVQTQGFLKLREKFAVKENKIRQPLLLITSLSNWYRYSFYHDRIYLSIKYVRSRKGIENKHSTDYKRYQIMLGCHKEKQFRATFSNNLKYSFANTFF